LDALSHPDLAGAAVTTLTTAEAQSAFTAGGVPADVVVLDGVLGAATDPLVALRAVRERSRVATVISCAAIAVGGRDGIGLWEFGDDGWRPTVAGLEGLCIAAGYTRTDIVGDTGPAPAPGAVDTFGLVVRAWR
jgi:hypothetical protein